MSQVHKRNFFPSVGSYFSKQARNEVVKQNGCLITPQRQSSGHTKVKDTGHTRETSTHTRDDKK